MFRTATKQALRVVGLHVGSLEGQPYGVDPFVDAASLCPAAGCVFDVGANYGQTVEAVRGVLPAATIYAFEPVPRSFAVLAANTAHRKGVELVNCALGDTHGQIEISLAETNGQDGIGAKPGAPTLSVPITTIDLFCQAKGIDNIDLLKIDTEGYEPAVLRGANDMLARGAIQMVLAECEFARNPDEPHGDFAEIFALLSPQGYRIVSFYTGGVDGNGWRWGDVLFMRPQARATTRSPYGRAPRAG